VVFFFSIDRLGGCQVGGGRVGSGQVGGGQVGSGQVSGGQYWRRQRRRSVFMLAGQVKGVVQVGNKLEILTP